MKKRLLALTLSISLLFTGCSLLEDDYYEEGYEEDNEDSTGGKASASFDDGSFFSTDEVREKQVKLKGNGEDTVTVLVYMNGSDLETDDSEATTDLSEMLAAGGSDKVNVLVQTMGTKKWDGTHGIASDRSQIYSVGENGLELVKDDLGQLDCTKSQTLAQFIIWGAQNYPADRYIMLFWDHGGGPVYGYGYDQWNSSEDATLTLDEMQAAFNEAKVFFDFIGMDCCIMSCMEVACALYDYCDYTVLSEDFESGLGWSYTGWLKALYENTSIETPKLAKILIDDMVDENESGSEGDDSIMALIDQSMMKVLYSTWVQFAYANEDTLLNNNYSRKRSRPKTGRIHPLLNRFSFWGEEDDTSFADYYITDIMSVASNIDSTESQALASAVNKSLLYVKACGEDTSLTGLAVTLPYGDEDFYYSLKTVFGNCGFESEYINWLQKFTSASGDDDYYDYDSWDDDWTGWGDYEDDYDWSEYEGREDDSWCSDGSCGFDNWNFEESWNNWLNDEDGEDDDYSYENEDDWFWGDEYPSEDNWYSDDYDDDYGWFDYEEYYYWE